MGIEKRIKHWFERVELNRADKSLQIPEGKSLIVGIRFNQAPETAEEEKAAIKEIKGTPFIDSLKEKGLQWVPLPQRKRTWIALLIGTAAVLGSAYIGYKQYNERIRKR